MIQVLNRQIIRNISFDDYVALPGWSHSMIKLDGVNKKQPTKKMFLGQHVHSFLHEPEKYNYENIEVVRPAANALRKTIGDLFKWLECEVVITCDFVYRDMVLNYKGRIDEMILDKVIVDIKASSMPLEKSISYFGYGDQLSGYSIAAGAKVALIVRVDPESCKPGKTPITQVHNIPIVHDWWMNQILKYGKPL